MPSSGLNDAVVLRKAVAEDLPKLLDLAHAFYDEDGFTTSDEELRENLQVLLSATRARITLTVNDGQLCGYALTTIGFTLESGTIAELQELYVRPEDRKRGFATLLIHDAVEWAKSRSASLVEVVVAPNGRDVDHLFRYYEARGFADEGRRILSHPLA